MATKWIFFLLLIMICVLFSQSSPSLEELEAMQFVNISNTNFLEKIKELQLLVMRTKMIQDFPIIDLKNDILFSSFPDPERLKSFSYQTFENEDLKRQIQVLRRIGLFAFSRKEYFNVTNIVTNIRNYHYAKYVCAHNSKDMENCLKFNLMAMTDLSYRKNDLNESKYLWKAGRRAFDGITTIVNLKRYAHHFRAAAKLNKLENTAELWYQDYEGGNIVQELEAAMVSLRPLYIQLHTFIRNILKKKHPNLIFDKEAIPQHILNMVVYRSGNQNLDSEFLPYPELNPSYFDDLLVIRNNTFMDNINAANDFFQSMGMIDLTPVYVKQHIRVSKGGGSYCSNHFYDLDADISLRCCAKADFKSFVRLHGDMALIQYALHKSTLPIGLNKESCPGFGKALAKAATLSATNLEYLRKIGISKDYKFYDEMRLNILIYMAIDTLIPIAEYFVEEKLWINILEGNIEPKEYNCFYWSLMKDYAGIEPPEYRTDVHFDVHAQFFDISEERPVAKMFSKLMGYQLYTSLCELEGQTLDKCNWFDNGNIGKRLSEIMSLGSRKSWREVLAILDGQNKINVSGILSFFAPLQVWLTKENEKNGANVGWNSSLKCEDVSNFFVDENVFEINGAAL